MRLFSAPTLVALFLLIAAASILAGAPGANTVIPDWTIEEVDEGGQMGAYTSVAIDPASGTTYISYFDAVYDDLRVARYVGSGGNCGASNDWNCEVVDASVQGGQYSSIAIDPATGLPGVAYHDAVGGDLRYAAYTCGGSCGWTVHTVDPGYVGHVIGQYASLDYMAQPYIAYTHSTIQYSQLWLAHYVGVNGNCGPNGNTWWCHEVNTPADTVQYTSLSTAGGDGPIRIAYYAVGTGLQLATPIGEGSGNCGPDNEWFCDTIDLSPGAGRYASLVASPIASPRIAYYDSGYGTLKLATYVQTSGNCGPDADWQCEIIDIMGDSIEPMGLSMALDRSGLPVIAYQDAADDLAPKGLKVARPIEALGLAGGNCGPSFDWYCEAVDPGGQYLNEANFVGIAVDRVGLPVVAYRERDSYYYTSNLKVAYQQPFAVYLPLVVRGL